jgi:hypothetical protein
VLTAGLVRETLIAIIPGYNLYGNIPIFPTLPTAFPIKVGIVLDTTVGTTKSLQENRVAQQQFPLWDIELVFEELRDQTQNSVPYQPLSGWKQYQALVQLFLSMYGQGGVFAFDCPWDNSRTDQLIGTGDGVTYAFTLSRTWGQGANATTTPIGMINTMLAVYVNGTVVPSTNYYVSRNVIYFIDANGFTHAPGASLPVTATFSYYYLCRFVEDEQDFEEFAKNRWAVPNMKIRAVSWV